MPSLSLPATLYLFHHVVLPPKLPETDDWNAEYEDTLLRTTVEALRTFSDDIRNDEPHIAGHIDLVESTISNLRRVRSASGFVSDSQLEDLLQGLASGETAGAIPLEIKAQNAAVVVSKEETGSDILFEVFELSPLNDAVMGTKGRLRRSFPTYACHVSLKQFQEHGLIKSLAHTLERMSCEEAPGFQPQSRKNEKDHDEIRNTTHPGLITDFFMHLLSVLGQQTEVKGVWKSTREDVIFNSGLLPWRRSPLWLLVRATMQIQFARISFKNLYKAVMVNLLATVLRKARMHPESIGADQLYIISAKLTGRVQKLRKLISDRFFCLYTDNILTLLKDTRSWIAGKIGHLADSVDNNIDLAVLASLEPRNDLDIDLPQLDEFIEKIYRRKRQSAISDFHLTSKCLVLLEHELPTDFQGSGEYTYFYLAAVETWVEDHLPSWLERHISDNTTCEQLNRFLKEYFHHANSTYSAISNIPRSLSTMYLTAVEIWIACDKCACNIYPLLRDFEPEVDLSSFQSLSLPFKSQLTRLLTAEAYLQHRGENARVDAPSLYRDFGHSSSFAVRFFDGSLKHQRLLSDIERDAMERRQRKCDELVKQKQLYNDLMARSDQRNCDYHEVYNRYYHCITTEHAPWCEKHRLQTQAEELQIEVHEWPLSSEQAIAKATVFELQIPKAYSYSRDATIFLLTEVLGFTYADTEKPRARYVLSSQDGLRHFWGSPSTQRINLLSEIKPLSGSHYRIKRGVAFLQETDVCVENALRYQYFDSFKDTFVDGLCSTRQVQEKCTHILPDCSSQLQTYLQVPATSDDLTPNQVIANLSNCPSHFSLDEYKAFGALSIGYKIQYQNILVQLVMPAVDFAKVETQCLILQTIHRAGPSSSKETVERSAHEILTAESFCRALASRIKAALGRVSENWETWRAVATLVQLTLRMLSVTNSQGIAKSCLELLENAREIALKWLNHLKKRVPAATDDSQRHELSSRLNEIGLLCISTFDADEKWLGVILNSASAVSILIQASIVVQENRDVTTSEYEYLHRAMLQSWRLLLFRAFPMISRKLSLDIVQDGLNEAVVVSWAGFCPTDRWSVLENPHHHWIHVTCDVLVVHFNLLTAELLVNGLPLSRLPQRYMDHPSYSSLFDKSPIEVMPTSEPGMEFSAKRPFHPKWCYNLSFGMEGSNMLILAAREGTKFDCVPSHVFEGLLPTIFVDDYFHWYNYSTGEVQFRPRDDPWSSTSELWRLERGGTSWRLVNGRQSLLGPGSKTARTISKLFSPLELQSHVHVLFENSSTILIELPRRRLGFRYTPGEPKIHSHQYQGMIIDTDQRIGTLSGLINKLILKHEQRAEDRLVLIPESGVQYSTTTTGHVSVSIKLDSARKTHAYHIDEVLGRLIDNGNLQSKLFLCYLHALTSSCVPDALTGHRGTETALTILRSGAVSSFDVLTAPNMDILKRIADLTPAREFYPTHRKVMQRICWDRNLSFMSQDAQFYIEVGKIFSMARKMKVFQPDEVYMDPPKLDSVNLLLLQRDITRTSTFRVDGFGAEEYSQEFDQNYEVRAKVNDPERGRRCSIAAEMILRNQPTLHSPIHAYNFQTSLRTNHFHNATVQGPNEQLEPLTLRYSASWLSKPSSFLPAMWCNLHSCFAKSAHRFNKFDLMIWLSTTAFADAADIDVIQALAAFYNCRDLASIEIPQLACFALEEGDSPTLSTIQDLVKEYREFRDCPEDDLPQRPEETYRQWENRKTSTFHRNQSKAVKTFADALHAQWPCEVPVTPRDPFAETYLYTTSAMSKVRPKFKVWYDNRCFYQYLEKVSCTLAQQRIAWVETSDSNIVKVQDLTEGNNDSPFYGINNVFNLEAPLLSPNPMNSTDLFWPVPPASLQVPLEQQTVEASNQISGPLASLCQKLRINAKSSREKDYILDLRDSCDLLAQQEARYQIRPEISNDELIGILKTYLCDCQQFFDNVNSLLWRVVQTGDRLATDMCQSPRISQTFWLRQLNRDRFDSLSQKWKAIIVNYGLAVTELHRAQRLITLSSHPYELAEELRNRGHQNWSPMDFPETLLLEAESGLLVREVQEEIAKQMRCPPNDANSVMQLNMGEGKSSVIVPIIAASLAQGRLLVRIIVARSQSRQMFQMIVSKLGGLLNRRIYHMPFSRDLKLDASQADTVGKIYEQCMASRGIMLVQPEHILSFKLMGIECLLNGQHEIAKSLLRTQRFFDNKSRDIVDESDENFSVKFELTYTMGTQRPIELSPERWSITHSVLELVLRYAAKVKERFPSSIEINNRWESRYPRIRVLQSDAEEELLDTISDHICEIGISGFFSIARQPSKVKQVVRRYIRNSNLTAKDIKEVENGPFWTETTIGPLLILRGLIACGVLSFALKSKRWRVNYGIDPIRTPKTELAVPYRSKDSPSLRSEFSHPDVVITLTTLSYYYGGLDNQFLFDTFAHLEKSDQADVEYREWVRWAGVLPDAFQHLAGVNIKDRHQCTVDVFPPLRYSKGTIDYFLSNMVFPKAMKEFPHKLAASGWDLGAIKSHPTTGFSGTNDSRQVLPLSVHYLDSEKQKHTNALVLAYLLKDESSVELLPPQTNAEQLLDIVNAMEPPTQVILDAGAQILELSNIEVAKRWLGTEDTRHAQAKAVVFFDDNEELSVLDRSGCIEPLQTSPFSKHLDECLVYLDQAHTRGTDLKLPKNYRAAVTLGANLTKDTLVQACMRMRKLGKGQSVVFCIPEEIQMKILGIKLQGTEIDVSDVIIWAITETWADIHRSIPLWASQGRRYEDHKGYLNGEETTVEQAKMFLEKEAQSLDDRYRPRLLKGPDVMKDWDTSNKNICKILEQCHEFEATSFDTATLQEEQERELCPEIEEEREVERPPPMKAERHQLHPDLDRLVATGRFPERSDAFLPAFQALKSTSAAERFDLMQFPNDLLVTMDFIRTVKRPGGSMSESYVSDSYLRPVQWILSVMQSDKFSASRCLIILSPFEAEQLLQKIQKSSMVTLHLYAPRPTQGYDPLDALDLYCVGREFFPSNSSTFRSQIVQLNLFAGQLYFDSYTEYTELCKYLGVAWEATKVGEVLQADGFVIPPAGGWRLEKSPVGFLKDYIKIRRESEGIEKTHLGKVLEGGLLEKREFEFN